ncbi:MAG TPA: hypothetical protein VD710_03050 [Nitrososphaeraceae archaeon]|nr:hypothetical protein [Nitrososphaeraceae archaeon]
MSTKLETETFAGKSMQAYKDQAAKAGITLRAPLELDSGGFPEHIYGPLRRFRRNIAITKDHKKIVITMHRQLVPTRDEKGKPTKKEYLTYSGYYSGVTFKAEEHHADFEIGKYQKPKIIHNPNLRYDPKTGEPIGNEKALGVPETVWTIEVPKSKTERKKLIDEIIGDNHAEDIKYYFDNEGEPMGRSDPTFSYDEFVNLTIEEMRKLSYQGGGSLTPGIWRDNDGKLRDKFGQVLSPESGNKVAYQ